MEPKFVVDVKNLKKKYDDKVVVDDVSLQIHPSEILGLVGPNGQGKTTTMRMLCGLLTPDGGSGQCLGYDVITQSEEIKFYTGYMPQNFSLYEDMTVYENLRLLADLYGILNRDEKIDYCIDLLQLERYRDRLAGAMSMGYKQKLSLASALLNDALFLILDEPTASIDPQSRKEIWDILHGLATKGLTILVTSHNLDEIEHCDRIAYLNKGKILLKGTVSEVINTAKLVTWSVHGPNLTLLSKQLVLLPSVAQVISVSQSLHVSCTDEDAFLKEIEPFYKNPNFHWERTKTTLTDVFVWFTK